MFAFCLSLGLACNAKGSCYWPCIYMDIHMYISDVCHRDTSVLVCRHVDILCYEVFMTHTHDTLINIEQIHTSDSVWVSLWVEETRLAHRSSPYLSDLALFCSCISILILRDDNSGVPISLSSPFRRLGLHCGIVLVFHLYFFRFHCIHCVAATVHPRLLTASDDSALINHHHPNIWGCRTRTPGRTWLTGPRAVLVLIQNAGFVRDNGIK